MKQSQRQFLVRASGLPGNWATHSGGNITADATKVYDGGSNVPEVLTGPAEADNMTLSRPYDQLRDAEMLRSLKKQVGVFQSTLSVQPTDRNFNVVGRPRTYPDAVLIGITEPDSDVTSGDAAQLELEFAIGAWA